KTRASLVCLRKVSKVGSACSGKWSLRVRIVVVSGKNYYKNSQGGHAPLILLSEQNLFDSNFSGAAFRQLTLSDVDPVVNRSDEAVTLGGKSPTLFIFQEELHHGKVMHRLRHECSDLRLVEVRTSTREHLPEGLTVLVGSMDHNGVAPHVNLVILHT